MRRDLSSPNEENGVRLPKIEKVSAGDWTIEVGGGDERRREAMIDPKEDMIISPGPAAKMRIKPN